MPRLRRYTTSVWAPASCKSPSVYFRAGVSPLAFRRNGIVSCSAIKREIFGHASQLIAAISQLRLADDFTLCRDHVRSKLGIASAPVWKTNGNGTAQTNRRTATTYRYENERGELLFEVTRFE